MLFYYNIITCFVETDERHRRIILGKGKIQIYYGVGRGKTHAALGNALRAANDGKTVYVIQFLKGKLDYGMDFYKRLEPEIKFFCFEKSADSYDELTEDEKKEAIQSMKNGLNFSKKVLSTGECNILILDEVLGLVDTGVILASDLEQVIKNRPEDVDIILTGRVLDESVRTYADEIYNIIAEKTE